VICWHLGKQDFKRTKNQQKKYDLIEFMVTGEIEKSLFDIKRSILQNNIQ